MKDFKLNCSGFFEYPAGAEATITVTKDIYDCGINCVFKTGKEVIQGKPLLIFSYFEERPAYRFVNKAKQEDEMMFELIWKGDKGGVTIYELFAIKEIKPETEYKFCISEM